MPGCGILFPRLPCRTGTARVHCTGSNHVLRVLACSDDKVVFSRIARMSSMSNGHPQPRLAAGLAGAFAAMLISGSAGSAECSKGYAACYSVPSVRYLPLSAGTIAGSGRLRSAAPQGHMPCPPAADRQPDNELACAWTAEASLILTPAAIWMI